jgi:hypothetical protein
MFGSEALLGNYLPSGFVIDRKTSRFGSFCEFAAPARAGPQDPEMGQAVEFTDRSAAHRFGLYSCWGRKLCIVNHGREIVNALSEYEDVKRLGVVDSFGRKWTLEEQRIDLSGPKKTIVSDGYRNLRVLSQADAERILRTRQRDYLDKDDADPYGAMLRWVGRPN